MATECHRRAFRTSELPKIPGSFRPKLRAEAAPNPFTVPLNIGVLPLFFLGYREASLEDFPGLDLR